MSKRAVILAGGKGTRLKPYTVSIPKPLVPLDETPILEIIIQQLKKSGFDHLTLAVNHMSEIIKDFCKDGSKWSIKIDYSFEEKPLSTMGPLKLIDDLPENFLVMNGDILTNLDFSNFYEEHVLSKSIFSISSFDRLELVDYGVLETKDEKLIKLEEKPLKPYEVSMGIYMMSKEALDFIPKDKEFGFDHLMHSFIENNHEVRVVKFKDYWQDIGRPSDYIQASKDFKDFKKDFL
ncbi:MAG: nucleoside-diphosphate-sugar pyrophosphorylase [Gammaproteobacteria bacterium]|nr:nucleoside-diphosphate-sugar pyrophosphorylase [Gammaproteobacteria bacterium]|tara:strand:- start:22252 stop:22956 length:705 start_codon:yes stop_codon:yes gene_type:complete